MIWRSQKIVVPGVRRTPKKPEKKVKEKKDTKLICKPLSTFLLPKYDDKEQTFVEPYLPNYKIGIMHLAAGIWKDGKDMRVDKSIKIEIKTLDNKRITTLHGNITFFPS